jgi:hypothetical protein
MVLQEEPFRQQELFSASYKSRFSEEQKISEYFGIFALAISFCT